MSHLVKFRAKAALLMVAGGLGLALAGAASAAAADAEAPTLVVRYSTDSLSTHSGVQELYRRIVRAARQVCPETSIRDLRANELARACREQAVSKAIRQINNSQLAALHANSSKSG